MPKLKDIREAFSKALGLPENDDKIREHKELLRQLKQKQVDLDKLHAILKTLQTEYTRYKHRIFYIRYRQMKRMIKSAAGQMANDMQNQSTETEVEGQGGANEYKENCRKLDEQEKYYSELSAEQLREDLRNFPAQIELLKEEFSEKRRIIEQLGEDYETSKSMLYPNRYLEMKRMIKAAVPASAPPRDHHHQRHPR